MNKILINLFLNKSILNSNLFSNLYSWMINYWLSLEYDNYTNGIILWLK